MRFMLLILDGGVAREWPDDREAKAHEIRVGPALRGSRARTRER